MIINIICRLQSFFANDYQYQQQFLDVLFQYVNYNEIVKFTFKPQNGSCRDHAPFCRSRVFTPATTAIQPRLKSSLVVAPSGDAVYITCEAIQPAREFTQG